MPPVAETCKHRLVRVKHRLPSDAKSISRLLVSKVLSYLDAKHCTLILLISAKRSLCCRGWTFGILFQFERAFLT